MEETDYTYEIVSRLQDIAEKITTKVLKTMSPNTTTAGNLQQNLQGIRTYLRNNIVDAIRESGFDEKYIEARENALNKEDLENEYTYFSKDGNILPSYIDPNVISDTINKFAADMDESKLYWDVLGNERPNGDLGQYNREWLEDFERNKASNPEAINNLGQNIMADYATGPEIPTAQNTYYNIGLKQPTNGAPEPFVFGNEKKMLRHDSSAVAKQDDIGSFKFQDILGSHFEKDSALANPDISEQYSDMQRLFTVDGKKANTSDIAMGLELGRNVEFTRFTINEKGECGYEKIPLAHAFQDSRNNIKEHIEGPADEKAKKVAQDITEKLKISSEKKRLEYLNAVKKNEAECRNKIIKECKDQIRNARNKSEKKALQANLKSIQETYKKIDKAMKPRQKAAEKECKNNIKKYEKERKNRIKADAKAERDRIKAERARQKAAERAARRNGGQPQAAMQEPLVAAETKEVNRISIRQRADLRQEVSERTNTSRTGQRTAAPTTEQDRTRQSEVTSQRNGH